MAQIDQVEALIEEIAPAHLAEAWDNSGFQIRCAGKRQIRKILVSLEISENVISEAIGTGADMIVTHHPLLFRKTGAVDDNTVTGNYIIRLIQAGISVYSAHTSFDSARHGTNQYLAEKLGLKEIRPLLPAEEEGCGMGREGTYEERIPFDVFMKRLISVCDRNIYRIAGPVPESVSKVSLCTGAGSEFIENAWKNGSDVYVTGDVKYHDGRDACERGICVVDAGHFGTENIFSENFSAQLREKNPGDLDILVSRSDLNPFSAYRETL